MEEWRDIQGYEGLYQVSSCGRVKSLERKVFNGKDFYIINERILKPVKTKVGYKTINLSKDSKIKHYLIHRLVAESFIPNPNNYPCINHLDEQPYNNYKENLEWCTHKYNNNYGNHNEKISKAKEGHVPWNKGKTGTPHTKEWKINHSKRMTGTNNSRCRKVTCITTGETFNYIKEAAEKYNICPQGISHCCRGKYKTAGKLPNGTPLQWKYID